MAIDQEWLEDNGAWLVGGALALGLAVTNAPSITQNMAQTSLIKEQRQASAADLMRTEFANDDAQRLAETANERLKKLCTPLVGIADPNSFVDINTNEAPIDQITKVPLAAGTCVFNAQTGMTGIVQVDAEGKSVVGDLAQSDSMDLLIQARNRYQGNLHNPAN